MTRSRRLRALARWLDGGIGLVDALGRVEQGARVERARALALEGAGLGEVLVRAGWIRAGDAGLVDAGRSQSLRLLADEAQAEEGVRRFLGERLVGPLVRAGLALGLGGVVLALGVGQVESLLAATRARGVLEWVDPWAVLAVVGVWCAGLVVSVAWGPVRRRLQATLVWLPWVGRWTALAARARFLEALGVGLEGGLGLPEALVRARGRVGGGPLGAQVEALVERAREGCALDTLWAQLDLVDETTTWVVSKAAERADAPRELRELGERARARWLLELQGWVPTLVGLIELAATLPIAVWLLYVTLMMFGPLQL